MLRRDSISNTIHSNKIETDTSSSEEDMLNLLNYDEKVEPKIKKTEMIDLWTKMTDLLKNQIREESQHANDHIKRRHF